VTVRFIAAAIIVWQALRAAEHGGPWIALACLLALIGIGIFLLEGLRVYCFGMSSAPGDIPEL
jgi:hypothetical protein